MCIHSFVRLIGVFVATVLLTLSVGPPAHAADPALRAAAIAQVNLGIDALTAGRWADAVRELEVALPLAEQAQDPRLIGGCHRGLAKAHDGLEAYDAALVHYRAYLALNLDEALKRKEVEDRVATLERLQVARVLVSVDAPSAQLFVNGAPTPISTESLRLAPGPYTVRVTAPGFEPHEERIVLAGGQTVRLAVRMRPVAEPVATPAVNPPGGDPFVAHIGGDSGHSGDVHAKLEPASAGSMWPWLTLGLGAAAGGLGTWFILDGNADWQLVYDAQDDPASMSQTQADALVADGDSKRTLGLITGGVGAALVVTGVIMLLTQGGDDAAEASTAPTLSPLFSDRVVGLSWGGGF